MKKATRKNTHRYAVIMAGGGGTRLWPMSRGEKPKQFHSILGEQSLLQKIYAMLSKSFDERHICIQIPAEFLPYVKEQIKGIRKEQILIEPESRDTGPAFALATMALTARDPEAVVGFYYSDHFFQSDRAFSETIEASFANAEAFPDRLVLVGVRPLYPHTGLGYIEAGQRTLRKVGGTGVHEVRSFVEKPDLRRAKRFVASHKFLWNTGYKIGQASHILKLMAESNSTYKKLLPELKRALESGSARRVATVFRKLPRQSFEYAITENARGLLVVVSDMPWSDVGDWEAIDTALTGAKSGETRMVGSVVDHGSTNSLIISHHRPVIAIGLKDIVVVETEHGVLVMSKHKSREMKHAIAKLRAQHPESL